jgi:RHS repeat-associated protein
MSALSVTSQSKTDATQYLWDINHGLPQVLTESGKKGTALYSYGLGRISMADPKKGSMYYQYDGLGSVRSLTDRKGMTKALYYYDVFGKPLITASHVDNDFQYTGEQVDDETGLIYLRARYYDPEIGRFISRDPFAGFDTAPQSLNRYTYVQNNPVVYTDPSGKVAPALVIGGAAVIGALANAGWYYGVDVRMRGQPFSAVTFGGRLTGGAVGGAVAAITAIPALATANPYVIGAAAGGSSYLVDRGTQAGLSYLGVRGTSEEPSVGGFLLATGSASVMNKVTSMLPSTANTNAATTSMATTAARMIETSVIKRSGGSVINTVANNFPPVYGPPFRASSNPYTGGKLY